MRIGKRLNKKKYIAIIILIVIVLICCVVFFVLKNNAPQKTTKSDSSKNSAQIISSKSSSSVPAKISDNTMPISPSGTFVSNHRPNLSGNPSPDLESSTCTTTPGAQCKITFTKDNQTLELETKTTNADGSASWEWRLSDIHLTIGEWLITATAINGTQTSSSVDSLKLIVSQ